jgi:hypothetical protein
MSHRNYLQYEEEKRKRARVVRAAVQGPLLKWMSRGEEIKVVVDPRPPAPATTQYGFAYSSTPNFPTLTTGTIPTPTPYPYSGASIAYGPNALPPGSPASETNSGSTSTPVLDLLRPPRPLSFVPPAHPQLTIRTEKVCKNYVIHELGQHEQVPRPEWQETMTAMFGDHVKWEDLRVYVTKGRPLGEFDEAFFITAVLLNDLRYSTTEATMSAHRFAGSVPRPAHKRSFCQCQSVPNSYADSVPWICLERRIRLLRCSRHSTSRCTDVDILEIVPCYGPCTWSNILRGHGLGAT